MYINRQMKSIFLRFQFSFQKIEIKWLLRTTFRGHWIFLNTLMCRSHLVSFDLVFTSSGSKIWREQGGGSGGSLCACFPRSFSIQMLKNYLGFYRSEGNNCSIDFQKAWNPVGRTTLVCAHKGACSFSLVYLLKITSLDRTKFQKLA